MNTRQKFPVHRGAFLTIFVRISTDKQNTWIFGNFSDQLDDLLKDSCDFWRYLALEFEILVHKSTILTGKSIFVSTNYTFRQKYPYKTKKIMKKKD